MLGNVSACELNNSLNIGDAVPLENVFVFAGATTHEITALRARNLMFAAAAADSGKKASVLACATDPLVVVSCEGFWNF